jgi:hypothetical protein
MRRSTLAAGFLVLGLVAGSLPGHGQGPAPKEKPRTKQELMKRKLELGQQLLASLTMNDLGKASKQAEELLRIRKDPAWKVFKSPEYEALSNDFNRTAEGIIKASKEKNLEAAKLHYLGMTMACFNCHTYVRDRKPEI